MDLLYSSELRSAKWRVGPGKPGLFHTYATRIRDLTIYAVSIHPANMPPANSVLVIRDDGASTPLVGQVAEAIYNLARDSARALMN